MTNQKFNQMDSESGQTDSNKSAERPRTWDWHSVQPGQTIKINDKIKTIIWAISSVEFVTDSSVKVTDYAGREYHISTLRSFEKVDDLGFIQFKAANYDALRRIPTEMLQWERSDQQRQVAAGVENADILLEMVEAALEERGDS